LLTFASPVHASIITSKSDPALFGATIIDFEGLPLGSQTGFTLPGVSIFNGLSILNSDQSVYGMSGQTLTNIMLPSGQIRQTFDFIFSSPVSAFALQVGAIDQGVTYEAFDALNNSLGIVPFSSFPAASVTFGFRGIQADGIDRVHFAVTNNDGLVMDDLYFVPEMTPIPEPSTMLLMGSGLFLMVLYVWRRECVQQV